MKKLQASYNNDANKIVKESAQEKVKKKLNYSIHLAIIAMVAEDTKPTKDETKTFNIAWNHPDFESQK